jgi:predicted nucleic acid-binding protein
MKKKVLIDSNIIIYAAQPGHASLREFIEVEAPANYEVYALDLFNNSHCL